MSKRVLLLACAVLLFSGCETIGRVILRDCRVTGCDAGQTCGVDGDGTRHTCQATEPEEPQPAPTEIPVPVPTIAPPASPEPDPSPKPSPLPPSPLPCATPVPCVKPEGCSSCAQYIAWALAGGHLTRLPNGLLYNDPGGNAALREYVDPKTCFMVWPDGSLRNKRYHLDGTICPACPPVAPCNPPESPESSPAPPNPQATPATCPPLMRVGGGLFNCQRNGIPKPCDGPLTDGDRVTLDSTHHFGRRTASACDEPHDKPCGGRMCDDIVRGTNFVLESDPGGNCRKTGTHQLTCGPMSSGHYRINLCAPDGYQDQLGQPVNTSQSECTLVQWDVQ